MARLAADPIHTANLKARIRSTLVSAGISQHKFAVFADISPGTLTRYLAGTTWSESTETLLDRALARLPKRKRPKHRRINLEEERHGKA
jgi:hypothetical protein